MSDPHLHARVRQHAETARLLGVDFVPVYRSSSEGAAIGPSAGPAPRMSREPETGPSTGRAPAPLAPSASRRERLDAILAKYENDAPHESFNTSFNCIVFDDGDPTARLMFVGEAPGADEDRLGKPFVGRAGQLLDKMIVAMGLRRQDVYIANVLKTRPPNNATPTSEECDACLPYLHDQIEVVRPEVMVTLGLTATRALLQTDASMSQMRGRWTEWRHPDEARYPDLRIPVMPTFHPAFLLRQYTEENRQKVWSDLREVMKRLGLPMKR